MYAILSRRSAFALTFIVACAHAELAAQSKPRIAVLAFANNTTSTIFGDKLGEAASDELTTQLVQAAQFSVIERQKIQTILAEQALGMSGAVEAGTAAKVGALLGAELVVFGSITQFSIEARSAGIRGLNVGYSEAESKLDIRVVNVNTGEILVVAEGEGKQRVAGAKFREMSVGSSFDAGLAQEALRPAIAHAMTQLLKQRPRLLAAGGPARVIKVVGVREGQVYLDGGENAGLEAGQRLTLMRVVDVIRDAQGKVLDEVMEKIGTVEIKRVLTQSSIGVLVEGASVQEGDRVGA